MVICEWVRAAWIDGKRVPLPKPVRLSQGPAPDPRRRAGRRRQRLGSGAKCCALDRLCRTQCRLHLEDAHRDWCDPDLPRARDLDRGRRCLEDRPDSMVQWRTDSL